MNRTARSVAAAAALVIASSVPAFAATGYAPEQPAATVVSTSQVAPGTRMLYVENLDGSDLTSLSLQPNVPSAFRVSVVDNSLASLSNAGFTVNSVLNNLYQSTSTNSWDFNTFIPSSAVTVNDPSATLNALGAGLTDVPTLNLSGTIDDCTTLANNATLMGLVENVFGALTSQLTALDELAAAAPALCGTGGLLLNGPLTIGSGGAIPTLTGVVSTLQSTVSGLSALGQLPFAVSGDTATATDYSPADFSNGIGQGKGPSATPDAVGGNQVLLSGSPTLSSGLLQALGMPADGSSVTDPLGLTSGTAVTTASDIEQALDAVAASGTSTAATDAATLINGLSQLDTALQGAGVSGTSGVDQVLGTLTGTVTNTLANLSAESGTYTAIPSLTVTPSPTLSPGAYQGTLTVTLVQQ